MQKPVHIQAMTMTSMMLLKPRSETWIHATGPTPTDPSAALSVPIWGSGGVERQ